ncbi:DUF402 domain-containing protein [Bacillus sp. SG-1]|uniref:DUF402 domain-containing protein n=1 Tax=Bacillus sp. SG-1 TaxID=161544 RepID=UPI0001544621|nr:DUF402 domain-containing protein [Bacillus sp. SG-1]EDL64606.1 hypothetical protein BSG1_09071 [Bacillus sp. SG-1]
MNVVVYWNHVGREHGGLEYTSDIRKNSPEIIEEALRLKENRALSQTEPNRFLALNESLVIELPPENSLKKFIIIYQMDLGLQFSYGFKNSHEGWLIDIVDYEKKPDGLVCVHDLLIDIRVFEDGSYHVVDMDEFYEAYSLGALSKEQLEQSLRALSYILEKLNKGEFPGIEIEEIKERYY